MKRTTAILVTVALLSVFSCWQCSKSENKPETPVVTNGVTDGDVTLSEDVTASGLPVDATAVSAPDAVSPTH